MGAAVGQVPDYVQMITEWVMEKAELPVLVKLTPNVTDIRFPARAARAANADGVALINTISSPGRREPRHAGRRCPTSAARASHGGYAGPAVKPIALNMVSQVAADPEVGIPVSGIGGIETWRDAVDFLLVGATTVQVGTSVMHYGFRLIDDLVDGLSTYLRDKGLHIAVRAGGQGAADDHRLGAPGPGVPAARQDRPGDAASTATCATRRATTAPTRRSASRAPTGRRAWWSRTTTAWAAACASTSARWRAASRSRSSRAPPPSTDGDALRGARPLAPRARVRSAVPGSGSARRSGLGFGPVQPAAPAGTRPFGSASAAAARRRASRSSA